MGKHSADCLVLPDTFTGCLGLGGQQLHRE
jgi:hypothetical protein